MLMLVVVTKKKMTDGLKKATSFTPRSKFKLFPLPWVILKGHTKCKPDLFNHQWSLSSMIDFFIISLCVDGIHSCFLCQSVVPLSHDQFSLSLLFLEELVQYS